ncbi:MAG: Calx-beta domain-containing protein [Marinifilaceae bacterium]
MKHIKITLSLVWALCLGLIFCSCGDEKVDGPSGAILSFKEAKLEVSDDDETVYLQLELTAPLLENCAIWLKCSDEEPTRFSFPEYIVLGKGAIRGRYPIYLKKSKFPLPDEVVTFSFGKVSNSATIDQSKSECELTILGKDNVGKVFIGFEKRTYNVGEDKGYYEHPFVVKGVLADNITVHVECSNGTAQWGTHFEMNAESVMVTKGDTWNYIPFQIFDDNETSESRDFTITLKGITGPEGIDTLVYLDMDKATCKVNIVDVQRKLQVTDSLVSVPEYAGKIKYNFNLTAPVSQNVTAKIRFNESSTAIEGTHFIFAEKEILIEAGETTAEVEVQIINDNLGNYNRKTIVELYDVEGIELSEVRSSGELVIENDDTTVGFGDNDRVMWSGSNLRIPLTVEGVREEPLFVRVEAISGTAEANKDFILLFSDIRVQEGDSLFFAEISAKNMSEAQTKNLKLKITTVKGLGLTTNAKVDGGRQECAVSIMKSAEINKADWTLVSCNSAEDTNPGSMLFDGDINTVWHTKWQGGEDAPPYIVVIDFGKRVSFDKVLVHKRQNRPNDARHTNLYISTTSSDVDSDEWFKIGEDTNANTGVLQNMVQINDIPVGRYLKVEVTKGRGDGATTIAALGEITVYGGLAD